MAIQLTDDQHRALGADMDSAIEVVDPGGVRRFYLIPAAKYEQIRPLLQLELSSPSANVTVEPGSTESKTRQAAIERIGSYHGRTGLIPLSDDAAADGYRDREDSQL